MKKIEIKTNKKSFLFVIRIFLYFVISVVFGLVIYSWNAKTLSGDMLPMPFNLGSAIVLSGSMEPELSVDDLIFISGKDEYFVGDVVVFQDEYSLVVHRIIKIEGDVVTTQGDANDTPDPSISISDIKGKVIGTIPGIGGFVSVIKSPLGIICILGIFVVLLILSYQKENEDKKAKIKEIKEEIRKLKENK